MKQQTEIWMSPTLCGCVLERTHTWRVSAGIVDKLKQSHPDTFAFFIKSLEDSGQYDEAETTYRILNQCKDHKEFPDADSLAAEFLNYGLNVRTSDQCGCAIVYHFDKRTGGKHVPVEHSIRTKRCKHHAHLKHHKEHHDTIVAEGIERQEMVLKLAQEHGVSHEMLWQFVKHDENRVLRVDHTSIHATVKIAKAAVVSVDSLKASFNQFAGIQSDSPEVFREWVFETLAAIMGKGATDV